MRNLSELVRSYLSSLSDRVSDGTGLWLKYEDGNADLSGLKRLLHTLKGEAHMLSLERLGNVLEQLEEVVVLADALGEHGKGAGDVVLEAFDALAMLACESPDPKEPFDVAPLLASLSRAAEQLRELQGRTPVEKAAARMPSSRAPARPSVGAPKGTEDAPRPLENVVRIEELLPSVHELRRLFEEHQLLLPKLREVQRILRAVVAEMDPSLPPAVLGEQVIKTLGSAADLERRLSAMRAEWSANAFSTGLAMDQLSDTARRASMQSVERMRATLERAVRVTAHAVDKVVHFHFEGDAYIDGAIAQRLEPVLLHVIRNAVDHGIESLEQRLTLGKPASGSVDVRVEQQSDTVRITVSDDGGGVDVEAVRARFGLGAEVSKRAVLRFLFGSGVSTRDVATSISGRGVGLDAVAREVESVGGSVEVDSERGKGFRLTITMPTVMRADLIVAVDFGPHRLAVPARNVEGFYRLDDLEATTQGAFARIERDGSTALIPVYALATLFGESIELRPGSRAVLIRHEDARFLLVVDKHGNPRALPFQPASELAFRSPVVRAVAPSPEGVRILLDVSVMTDWLSTGELQVKAAQPRGSARVVVVEDAPVARELLCGILRSFGMQVHEASHGGEGLSRVREVEPDLVLTDVEMPFTSGIEMVRELRTEARFAHLPVIMLTTDTRETTRQAAKALNVAGFLSKQKFVEQELRALVDRCLEGRL